MLEIDRIMFGYKIVIKASPVISIIFVGRGPIGDVININQVKLDLV